MRKILILLLCLPQIILAQYKADCFSMDEKGTDISLRLSIQKDTTIALNNIGPVYGFFVTGSSDLIDKKSYIRIVLKDDYNYDHLVYENNYLLADSSEKSFHQVALETKLLDERIVPKSMRIEVCNASLNLNAISYTNINNSQKSGDQIRSEQNAYIVEKMNENLYRNHIPWRAGKTSISEKSYEEKKSVFGGRVPELYGFDYYVGGVYVTPSMLDGLGKKVRDNEPSNFVNEWDWRNRHGKNWMTPVKDQLLCGTCWAFAGIGVLESYLNLYYNRLFVNNDWSEQEIISCNGGYNNQMGEPGVVFEYVKNNGVVPEGCFPYSCYSTVDCSDKCQSPDSTLSISNYSYIANTGENTIKQKVIQAPITIGFYSFSPPHIMVLVGYKVLEVGDTFFGDLPVTHENDDPIHQGVIADSLSYGDYIGETVWLVKNSWGNTWGDNGFGYVYAHLNEIYFLYSLSGIISCTTLSDYDIVCEDADGDGYFYWGIGPKPSSCPQWAPEDPDGDDSDASIGPLDAFGNPIIIDPSGNGTVVISSNQTITVDQVYNYNVVVHPNVTWTVKSDLLFHYGAHLRIMSGATVIIDGGSIISARIDQDSGSNLNMMNDGKIIPPANECFTVPVGANMEVTNGIIQY